MSEKILPNYHCNHGWSGNLCMDCMTELNDKITWAGEPYHDTMNKLKDLVRAEISENMKQARKNPFNNYDPENSRLSA